MAGMPDKPVLLSGGNPQIAKGEGDAVVQSYIDAIPGWKQAAARQMIAQGAPGGRIVFSSSVTGVAALPDCAPYAVTKAALRHMAKVLALELGPFGITVNALGIGASELDFLFEDRQFRAKWFTGRVFIYGALLLWAFICLFPIYWTATTSFKAAAMDALSHAQVASASARASSAGPMAGVTCCARSASWGVTSA